MKKPALIVSLLLLLITFVGCTKQTPSAENIHKRIHAAYYDISSYDAKCMISAYTQNGRNDYECSINYNKDTNAFTVTSQDMQMQINDTKAIISKGDNTLEVPSSDEDMYIFINTFFKSYYESESTSLSVGKASDENTTLLECDVINPSENTAHMKLWVNNKNTLPTKMQVYSKDNFMHTEIIFDDFKFE